MNLSRISKKVPHEDYRMTLLAVHENKIKTLKNEEATLNEKENLLNLLNKKYTQLILHADDQEFKNGHDLFYINKQIKELEKEIKDIIDKKRLAEYQLESMNFLQEYSTSNNKGQVSKNYLKECLDESCIINYDINKNDLLICKDCDINRVVSHKEAIAICTECGSTVNYQYTDTCIEFSEEIEVLSPFSYKRINHLKEWISMLLARESSSPPEDVIEKLLLELKKNRIYDKKQVTPERIREYLKKLGLNTMYEHIPLIIHKICGTTPINISKDLENKLIKMFDEIQVPFLKHKPPERKNFLSYSYCIFKFLQILKQDHLLGNLSLLKSREKLLKQDQLFAKICADLGWEFIPST